MRNQKELGYEVNDYSFFEDPENIEELKILEEIELVNKETFERVDRGSTVIFKYDRFQDGFFVYNCSADRYEADLKLESGDVHLLSGLEDVSAKAAAKNLVDQYLISVDTDEGVDPDIYLEEGLDGIELGDNQGEVAEPTVEFESDHSQAQDSVGKSKDQGSDQDPLDW